VRGEGQRMGGCVCAPWPCHACTGDARIHTPTQSQTPHPLHPPPNQHSEGAQLTNNSKPTRTRVPVFEGEIKHEEEGGERGRGWGGGCVHHWHRSGAVPPATSPWGAPDAFISRRAVSNSRTACSRNKASKKQEGRGVDQERGSWVQGAAARCV
jgi:hypothetical protein